MIGMHGRKAGPRRLSRKPETTLSMIHEGESGVEDTHLLNLKKVDKLISNCEKVILKQD